MDIPYNNHKFVDFGYVMAELPQSLTASLLSEAAKIQSDFSKAIPRHKTLAGHLVHEYELVDSAAELEKFVLDLTMAYDHEYNYLAEIDILTKSVPMVASHPWINFQQKYEFNPVHNHKGILSFVAWLKIPYDLKTEWEQGPGRHRSSQLNSAFQFVYVGNLGQAATKTIHIDKTFEGKIIIFPSKLMHCVYPFYTSDDYRISIAGNVMLDPD